MSCAAKTFARYRVIQREENGVTVRPQSLGRELSHTLAYIRTLALIKQQQNPLRPNAAVSESVEPAHLVATVQCLEMEHLVVNQVDGSFNQKYVPGLWQRAHPN